MSTITTILGGDFETNSRTVINTNFSNLNTDKIETSVLDTDTSLAANSDSKIATQKAVKAYVDVGGNVNASTTAKGVVEEATSAEVAAGTAAGGTGARLFINPSTISSILKFGGTGADGALALTSGTTTIDCANAALVIKNYTSISITSTGKLAFSNPHANGTTVILKSQGNVTLTSSTSIDASSMGAAGAATSGVTGSQGNGNYPLMTNGGNGGTHGGSAPVGGLLLVSVNNTATGFYKTPYLFCGAGGGGGNNGTTSGDTTYGGAGGGTIFTTGTSGASAAGTGTASGLTPHSAGGNGGGALMIECAGSYTNTSSIITVAGGVGATSGTTNISSGGGGAGGSLVILYKTLSSDTGTYTKTGGAGGTGGTNKAAGGAGATGYSYVGVNTEFA